MLFFSRSLTYDESLQFREFHCYTTDETSVSNGTEESLQDAQVLPDNATTMTPLIGQRSTISAEVAVVANVRAAEFLVLMTKHAVSADDQANLCDRCPTPLYFVEQPKMNGRLFADTLRQIRENYIDRCSRHKFFERYGVAEDMLQRAPLLLICDSPSFHKTEEVQRAAGMHLLLLSSRF